MLPDIHVCEWWMICKSKHRRLQLSVVFLYRFWEDARQSKTVCCLPKTLQRLCSVMAGALMINKVHSQPVSSCQSPRPSSAYTGTCKHTDLHTNSNTLSPSHKNGTWLPNYQSKMKSHKRKGGNIEWLHIKLELGEITLSEINLSSPINRRLRRH